MEQGSVEQADFFVNPEFIVRETPIAEGAKCLFCGRRSQLLGRRGRAVLIQKNQAEMLETPEREAGSGAADRFERRRADIVAAAIPVLNSHGFKGMRLTAVAELIGLRATGVTYYFPRKEDLAVACLESGYAIFHDLLAEAEREPDASSRIGRLIELFVTRDAAVRRGEATPLSAFAAIRAMEGEHQVRVVEGYKKMFRRVRALFETPELAGMNKNDRTIRTLILLEQLFWASAWLGSFELDDFPRLARRMTDIVVNGLSPQAVATPPSDIGVFGASIGARHIKENFLKAATRQINPHGYRGASVDRISASLNLTKGAFYHHNEAKDDLVADCFRRSFSIMREAQRRARALDDSEGRRLLAEVTALIRFQLGPEGPLLRTSVLSSMPPELQRRDHRPVLPRQSPVRRHGVGRHRRRLRPRGRLHSRRRHGPRRHQHLLRRSRPRNVRRTRHRRTLRPAAVRGLPENMTKAPAHSEERYKSFSDFYPFYIREHSNQTCRRIHVVGSALVLVILARAIVTRNPWWLLGMPLVGYGFAWVGHFFFEKNTPCHLQVSALEPDGRLADVLRDGHRQAEVLSAQLCRGFAREVGFAAAGSSGQSCLG